jgi:hypothetical protein
MRKRIALLTVTISGLMLPLAQAQKAAGSATRTPEVALSYDLVGSNAPAGQCGCFVLNGGSVTAAIPIPVDKLSAVGQISATHAGNISASRYDLTLLTYTFGLRYMPPLHSDHLSVFVQGLIGGSHAAGSLVGGSNPGSENAGLSLAGSVGGGVDLRWKKAVSLRVFEASYQPTTFSNHTTGLENNYRISAGIIFHMPGR